MREEKDGGGENEKGERGGLGGIGCAGSMKNSRGNKDRN